MDTYLGVDPATKTGIAVVDESGAIQHTEELRSRKKGLYRAQELALQVHRLAIRYEVSYVGIEGYAYGNMHTLVTLVEIGTLIRNLLLQFDLPYVDVAPNTLKKFLTGKGNAKKDQMMLHVYKRWGFEGTDNECDALALAQFVRCRFGGAEGFTAEQQKLACR